MFCEKCGKQITDGTAFCDGCGEKAEIKQEATINTVFNNTIVDAEKSKTKKKIFTSLVAVAAAMILIFVGVNSVKSVIARSGENYIYTVISKTKQHYKEEYNALIDKNVVLNGIKDNLKNSYTQTLTVSDYEITFNDDKENKVFSGEASVGLPFIIEYYLSDEKLVIGNSSLFYVEASAVDLGKDINNYAKANGLDYYLEDLQDILSELDISYSNLTKEITAYGEEEKELINEIHNVFKAFISKGAYTKEKQTIALKDKNVEGNMLTLTYDEAAFASWVREDLLPFVKNNEYMKNYFETAKMYSNTSYSELINQLEDLLIELEAADFLTTIKLSVYKDVIVKMDIYVENEEENFRMEIGATGEKYRLNNLFLCIYEDEEIIQSCTVSGGHIGEDVFTSTISYYDYLNEETKELLIEWDTKATTNNFILSEKDSSEDIKLTFVKDADKVLLKGFVGGEIFSWEVKPLESSVSVPQKTTQLINFDIYEIIEVMFEYGIY